MCSWFVSCRFCRSCIATSLKNNKWTCPYCRAYLPSEGVPATDVAKKMKSEFQKCTECDTLVCDPAFAHSYRRRTQKIVVQPVISPTPLTSSCPDFPKFIVSASPLPFLWFPMYGLLDSSHLMPTIT